LGFPTSEVGYTSATIGRGDHEVHKGHVAALKEEEKKPREHYLLMLRRFSTSDIWYIDVRRMSVGCTRIKVKPPEVEQVMLETGRGP
jgi:hypothetical protein